LKKCNQDLLPKKAQPWYSWQYMSFQEASIQESPVLKLEGIIERVTFHNEESGYSVLKVQVKGNRDLITVVGFVSSISPGESMTSFGQWIQTKEYGRQFKAKSIQTIPPSSLKGIEKYLGSGSVKGIGPYLSKKLVEAFGFDVFDIIEKNPEKLNRVEGIGPKRIELIVSAWQDQKTIRSIMVFLQGHGISTSKAMRIFKTYGESSVNRVRANPYQLAQDIHGIGFQSADMIAEKLGIDKNSLIRAKAGIAYVLMQRVQEGSCAYPEVNLLQEASELLKIEPTILQEAIEAQLNEGQFIAEFIENENCLYPAPICRCENEIARLLKRINQAPLPWERIAMEKAIPWVEEKIGIKLADLQKKAVSTALSSKITLITGGPGTGKSTLTQSIVTLLKVKNVSMALCSPTGRAAKRLTECTGIEAKTIHRTLGFDPRKRKFTYDRDNPLPIGLLLVDEASMIDIQLMHSLLKAVSEKTAIIIIGDVDQLPSVGPGTVLADLIESAQFPTVKLTEIFRQAAQSKIIQAAHQINTGRLPNLVHDKKSDFFFIPSDDPDSTVLKIVDLVKKRIPEKFGFNPVTEIQVLCPMLRGTLGARNLNVTLQKELNPDPIRKVERFGYIFSIGDKIMVIQNDYDKEVFNGDIGYIQEIDFQEQECLINIDKKEVIFDFNELDILQPAYTVTIHKSQGSEYPVVIIPVVTQHYMMLKKNLIYTGITRGKKLVILIGQKKALAIAIKTKQKEKRWTNLKLKIKNAMQDQMF
jgi:exodeoxyribonuclease V alpha subunit